LSSIHALLSYNYGFDYSIHQSCIYNCPWLLHFSMKTLEHCIFISRDWVIKININTFIPITFEIYQSAFVMPYIILRHKVYTRSHHKSSRHKQFSAFQFAKRSWYSLVGALKFLVERMKAHLKEHTIVVWPWWFQWWFLFTQWMLTIIHNLWCS
jgi:hypothetical protein